MWENLLAISQHMNNAWCIIGEFNKGGNETQGKEIKELANFMKHGDLQEIRWSGAYYSWINKIIWSRMDKTMINIYWHDANGLSDHSRMMVQFLVTIKPKQIPDYRLSCIPDFQQAPKSIEEYLSKPKITIKDQVTDLREQQEKARKELTYIQMQLQGNPGDSSLLQAERALKCKYNDILASSMELMQQQCKIEIFFAKAKKRKLAFHIYHIKDAKGEPVEGFDQVGIAMLTYYKALLSEWNTTRKEVELQVIHQGPVLTKEQQLLICRDFTDLEIKEALYSIPNFNRAEDQSTKISNGDWKMFL
ncbi:hypothetical protein Cgig2_020386 [Carnegiea gigantea]|uniref:Uncharacterized protein n=1 Tax=Carnegiea gigantea TaxID=171969 RepID=A0A9Q1JGH4_9CARY|nr:hypothetical protein Cgig2_020386 [Carnegiea gigantea]